ncbi:RICIN domain-containing protein [Nonomuraea sp. NPDC050153]|uniref:RICIN domain-containing protein n=1 Tax=Nonomuraea sp. NPDC050153 TaxID=3364359 RepID=UPI003790E6D5
MRTLLAAAGAASIALTLVPAPAAQAKQASAYRIVNSRTGQCLAVPNGTKKFGARIIQWPCNGSNSQKWYFNPYDDFNGGQYINAASNMCLAINKPGKGAPIRQLPCTGTTRDIWMVWGASNLQNAGYKGCLAVPNGTRARGAKMIAWPCLNSASQEWETHGVS